MPETPVIVGASLAVHFFSPRPATGGRAEEGLGHRGGAKRRIGAPYGGGCGSSDPMREAGAPSTGKSLACVTKCCARPTGGSHGRTTDAPAQRGEGAKHRPRCFSQPLVARPEAV